MYGGIENVPKKNMNILCNVIADDSDEEDATTNADDSCTETSGKVDDVDNDIDNDTVDESKSEDSEDIAPAEQPVTPLIDDHNIDDVDDYLFQDVFTRNDSNKTSGIVRYDKTNKGKRELRRKKRGDKCKSERDKKENKWKSNEGKDRDKWKFERDTNRDKWKLERDEKVKRTKEIKSQRKFKKMHKSIDIDIECVNSRVNGRLLHTFMDEDAYNILIMDHDGYCLIRNDYDDCYIYDCHYCYDYDDDWFWDH
jgi:hypothetical protein